MARSRVLSRIAALSQRIMRMLEQNVSANEDAEKAARDRYVHALEELPHEVRTTFLLHRAYGLDIETIAVRTGQTTAAVESQIADAILSIGIALNSGSEPVRDFI